jgi:hypothetical protein
MHADRPKLSIIGEIIVIAENIGTGGLTSSFIFWIVRTVTEFIPHFVKSSGSRRPTAGLHRQ